MINNHSQQSAPESLVLESVASLSDKLYQVHDSLAFQKFILAEYFEKSGKLTLQELNGFSYVFEYILSRLESAKLNLEVISKYIKTVKAREQEGRE